MANYLRYADDILRGGRRAAGNLVDAFPVSVPKNRMVLSGSDVPNVRGLDGVNFNFGDMPERAPVIWGRDGLRETIPDPKNGYPNLAGEYPSDLAGQSLPTPQRQNMGRLNKGELPKAVAQGALATGAIGSAAAGAAALVSADSQGAFDGISFDDVMARFGTPPTPTATPQVTDRDFDYVAPTPKAPAYVPDTSKLDLKPTYIPSETLPPIPEPPVGEAFYRISKGDNLWNLTGGDTELINKIAAYNNLDPNKIYADADLRLKNEWLTPSSRLLNNTLAGIRYPG